MATNVQLPYHKPFTKSRSKLFQKDMRERETLDRDRERDVDQQIHNKSKPQTKKQQQQAL